MGVLVLLTFRGGGGGVVQNRESPDFRSPEVGRYVKSELYASNRMEAINTLAVAVVSHGFNITN